MSNVTKQELINLTLTNEEENDYIAKETKRKRTVLVNSIRARERLRSRDQHGGDINRGNDSSLKRLCDILFDKRYKVVQVKQISTHGRTWFVIHNSKLDVGNNNAGALFMVCLTQISDPESTFYANISLHNHQYKDVVRLHDFDIPTKQTPSEKAHRITVLVTILNRCVVRYTYLNRCVVKYKYSSKKMCAQSTRSINIFNRVISDLFRRDSMSATDTSAWDVDDEHYFLWSPERETYAIRIEDEMRNEPRQLEKEWAQYVTVQSAFGGWKCTIGIDHDGWYHYTGASIYYYDPPTEGAEPPFKYIDRIIALCVPNLYDLSTRPSNKVPFSLIMPFRKMHPRPGLYAKHIKYINERDDFVKLTRNAGANEDLKMHYDDEEEAVKDIRNRLTRMYTYLENNPESNYHYWKNKLSKVIIENTSIQTPASIAQQLYTNLGKGGLKHDSFGIQGRANNTGPATQARSSRSLFARR